MNIAIVRAFISMRKSLKDFTEINEQLTFLKNKLGEHDDQLNEIFSSIELLLEERKNLQEWNDRERIGFKKE